MDIGLLVAGRLWRLQRGTAYGIREGRVMLDRRDRNPYAGAEFPVPAIVNPRVAAFTLPVLSNADPATSIATWSAALVRHGIRCGLRNSRTAWPSATAAPSGRR